MLLWTMGDRHFIRSLSKYNKIKISKPELQSIIILFLFFLGKSKPKNILYKNKLFLLCFTYFYSPQVFSLCNIIPTSWLTPLSSLFLFLSLALKSPKWIPLSSNLVYYSADFTSNSVSYFFNFYFLTTWERNRPLTG